MAERCARSRLNKTGGPSWPTLYIPSTIRSSASWTASSPSRTTSGRRLENLPMQVVVIKDGQDIVREGDRPSRSCLLLSGFACAYKMTGDGKRQIVGFSIAGDIPDLQSLHLEVLDNSVGTLTPCRVGFITARGPARPVRALPPHHRRLLARDPRSTRPSSGNG